VTPEEAVTTRTVRFGIQDRDQLLAAAVLGGAAFLLLELRFEHREVLAEAWQSWIPLLYCGVTLAAGAFALIRWRTWGRGALGALFALGIAVGIAGFWFHTGGHLLDGIRDLLAAWRIPLGKDGGIKMGSRPPAVAPLAFCGLGALGSLICFAPKTSTGTP
jgi:hypothetical protein